jgi:hypothetical protein
MNPHFAVDPPNRPILPIVARPDVSRLVKGAVYLWVLPTSAVAFPLLLANAATGGITRIHGGVVEAHGRWLRWALSRGPFQAAAMTLGHVVLNADDTARKLYRSHELVHVCQAERWGPLFLPLYLGLAVRSWRRTGHGYWDHPWEAEARHRSGI